MNPSTSSKTDSEKEDERELITTVDHHTGDQMPVYKGTFVYSGFGYGNLYLAADADPIWCTSSEAKKKAKQAGLSEQYRKIDPLSGYTGTYLGD